MIFNHQGLMGHFKYTVQYMLVVSLCNFDTRPKVPPIILYVSYFIRDVPVKEKMHYQAS